MNKHENMYIVHGQNMHNTTKTDKLYTLCMEKQE